MAKLKNFTKKQLDAIGNSLEAVVNEWEPDIIHRCHSRNVKEVHNMLDKYLNERIELQKIGDEAVKVLDEASDALEKVETDEKFDTLDVEEGLFVGEDTKTEATKKSKIKKSEKKVETAVKKEEPKEVEDKPKTKATKKSKTKKETPDKTDKEAVVKAGKEPVDTKEEVKSIREEVKDVRITPKFSDSLDIAISFDTTGSMYSVLATVRREIKDTVKQLYF